MSPQLSSKNTLVSVKSETSYHSPPSSLSDTSQHENEAARGRRQDRSNTAKAEEDSGEEKEDGGEDAGGKPRKRKRSRKGLEKNFPCPHQGCGKSYSRAEHLYRHQLNRECIVPDAFRFSSLTIIQTHRRKSIPAISLDASVDSFAKTYVLGIVRGTRRVARIFNGKRIVRTMSKIAMCKLWASMAHEITQIQSTGRLLELIHQPRTSLQLLLNHSPKLMRYIPCLLNLRYQEESLSPINQVRAAPVHLVTI